MLAPDWSFYGEETEEIEDDIRSVADVKQEAQATIVPSAAVGKWNALGRDRSASYHDLRNSRLREVIELCLEG